MSYSAIDLNDDADEPAAEPNETVPTSNQILSPDLPPLEPAYRRIKRQKRPEKK